MIPADLFPFVVILFLSIVQSLFGVGLLLFGTPILLSFGYQYEEALLFLLPASAAISWSQVYDFRHEKLTEGYRKSFFIFCFPALLLGMLVTSRLDFKYEIKILIIIMLTFTLILRTKAKLFVKLQHFIRQNLRKSLTFMGLIHGLSNMGGSILTPLASSLNSQKSKVVAGVSFAYAFMASFQIIVLLFISKFHFTPIHLWCPIISLSARYLLGKKVYHFTSEKLYLQLINIFILANAILLIIKL